MNAPHILRIRFKKGTQEISFGRFAWLDLPEIKVVNDSDDDVDIDGCTVWVNGKRYVEFLAEAESWEVVPAEGWG